MNEKYQLLFVAIVSITAFVLLYYSGLVEAYYNSIIGFGCGMLCGSKDYVSFIHKYKKGYLGGVVLLIIAFAAMVVVDRTSIFFALIRNLGALGAIIITLYAISFFKFDSKLNRYLCKVSPEIYFYHIPITLLLSAVINNKVIYFVVVIMATFIVVPVFNYINKWMLQKLKCCISIHEKRRRI